MGPFMTGKSRTLDQIGREARKWMVWTVPVFRAISGSDL